MGITRLTCLTVVFLAVKFVVIFSLGPAWEKDKPANEQRYFADHSANLGKLRAEKKLLLGARYADKGMVIIEAENEAAARAMFDADPMVKNRLFNMEVYAFSPFFTGCIN